MLFKTKKSLKINKMTDLEKYDKGLSIEHELINRRLTWLLSSQSILFAALAFVLGKDVPEATQKLFFKVVSCLGMGISLSIFVGVLMAVIAKRVIWKDYNKNHPNTKQSLGVRTWITILALAPDVLMPIAFVSAWWWLRTWMEFTV
jgi:hypothetical protein